MEERRRFGLADLVTNTNNHFVRAIKSWQIGRLKKGLSYRGFAQLSYGVRDILGGWAKKPESMFLICRYMQHANNIMRFGIDHGDMDAALTAASVFKWLGQGQRASVHRKVQKAYDRAREIAQEYDIPLSIDGDRSTAVMPSQLRREAERYLAQ